ncbi:hypothetical protein BpHYR1_052721 [Brachionus plicatilis]|uniref:Uncharacterized protein n=1 Tax=Brachionus plicatilis TaxID=10195 RepID=A0A3M7SJW7_BRAPC|nr:hypothetical protein BpHYR1_052721 [Brachionus plicatilis]
MEIIKNIKESIGKRKSNWMRKFEILIIFLTKIHKQETSSQRQNSNFTERKHRIILIENNLNTFVTLNDEMNTLLRKGHFCWSSHTDPKFDHLLLKQLFKQVSQLCN